jgi:hypothetical protein
VDCPKCAQATLDADGFQSWCPACDWNVLTGVKRPTGRVERAYLRVSRRFGKELLAEQVGRRPTRPRRTPAIVAAHIYAAVVLGVILLLPVAAIWLVLWGWPHWEAFVMAAVPLAVFWIVRPRPLRDADGWIDAADMVELGLP